jgi:hypothetical protein
VGLEALAIGSMAASVGGGILGGIGAHNEGQAAKDQARYRAAVANNNAILAEKSAQMATEAGDIKAQNESLHTAATIGTIKATQAASGLDVNIGTPVDVRESAADLGRLDAMTIRYNAQKEAYNARTQADSYRAQAGLDMMAGKTATEAGDLKAFTSILGGAASVGDKWASYRRAGVSF